MRKERLKECISLTDQLLTEYYQHRLQLLNHYLHPQCVWIGTLDSDFYCGKDEIISALAKREIDMPKLSLFSKEFDWVINDRDSCTIIGRYIGSTDESSHELLREMQRVTFVWVQEKNMLFIKHMHISYPLALAETGEMFPHHLGKSTKEYLEMIIQNEVNRIGIVCVKDTANIYHKIHINHILYLESISVQTVIHTVEEDIVGRIRLVDLERQIQMLQENMIIRVHRSFCVNKYYVRQIRRYELILDNDLKIPISKHRYQNVKELF